MKIFAIDPGNTNSAYCVIDSETLRPIEFEKLPNEELRKIIRERKFEENERAVIEMVACYGMKVGRDVFETCVWIGRLQETLIRKCLNPPQFIYREEEKLHICRTKRAKDSNIQRALIDRFAKHCFKTGKGTAKNPDWFYGFHSDIWAAYAVGLTYIETHLNKI
jgi:hypothetical protein